MTRPRIGITCGPMIDRLPPYIEALKAEGAEGVVFQVGAASAQEILSSCDGILIPGGGDIDPGLYSDHVHPTAFGIDRARDLLEKEVILAAHQSGKPLMGICRGLQIMGFAFGGDLYQDIDAEVTPAGVLKGHKHMPNQETHHIAHDLVVEPDSHLAQILGVTSVGVNSIHHQALKSVPAPLRVVGRAPDGLIEAVEDSTHPWFIGVQCHPERLPKNAVWKKFFVDFVTAARRACGRPS